MKLLRALAPIALLFLCVVSIELKAISTPLPLVAHHDNLDGSNPLRLEAARQWRSGHIPLWNPYKRIGMPLLADTTAAALYPPNFPFLLYGEDSRFRALGRVATLHSLLAAVFMYAFLRSMPLGVGASLLGGLVYACNGTMTWFSALYIQLQNSAAWLPLVLLAVHKASAGGSRFWVWVTLGGAAVALQFFAGYPEFSFYTALLAAGYGLTLVHRPRWWRPVAAVGAIYVAGLLLSAVQLVPAIELQSLSHRPLTLTLEMFQSLPASPWMMGGWPFPATPSLPPFALGGYHLGIMASVLLPAGLCAHDHPRRFFTIVLVFGLLMAVGPATRVNGWVYYLPALSAFRHPFKHLLEVFFAAAALAALGADSVLRGGKTSLALTRAAIVVAIAACILLPFEGQRPIIAGSLAIALAVFLFAAKTGRRGLASAAALAATCLCYRVNLPTVPGSTEWWSTEVDVGQVPLASKVEPGWRVLEPRSTHIHARSTHALFGDYPSEARVLGVHGAGPYLWAPLARATGMIEEETTFRSGLFGGKDETLAVLSCRYVVTAMGMDGKFYPDLDPSVYRLFSETPFHFRVMERTDALPRFRLVHQVRCADQETIDNSLHGSGRSLADLALVDCKDGRDRPSRVTFSSGEVRIVDERAGRIALATRISEDAPGFLVVSQSDYPGWKAYVNGAEQPIRRVYGLLQGIEVPAGNGEVVLEYDPDSFRTGSLVSAATALLLLVACLWSRHG